MATVNCTTTDISDDGSVKRIEWTPLTTTNADGIKVAISKFADKSVTFTGTFGAGGTVKLQGSNDGSNWFDLTDPQGNAISKTSAALEAVTENTQYIRPFVSAGDGTTSLTAVLVARLSNTLRT